MLAHTVLGDAGLTQVGGRLGEAALELLVGEGPSTRPTADNSPTAGRRVSKVEGPGMSDLHGRIPTKAVRASRARRVNARPGQRDEWRSRRLSASTSHRAAEGFYGADLFAAVHGQCWIQGAGWATQALLEGIDGRRGDYDRGQ